MTDPNASLPVVGVRQLLRVASVPYRAVIAVRNFVYRVGLKKTFHSPLAVISVGNLSVGGTGKTPTVAWLARWLRSREVRVAILSRGYGQLDSGQNDEALELELQLPDVPHLQHWDRVASAKLADEELEMQVLVLDDGFQHRRLARDLDIVLIDASESSLALRLLPGGLLREPLSSLRRAKVVLLTRSDQASADYLTQLRSRVTKCNPLAFVGHATHRPSRIEVHPSGAVPLEEVRGKRALAYCAIGNPRSFLATLNALAVSVVEHREWPDHHAYSADDVQLLVAWTKEHSDIDWILCTRKDWVKLQMSKIGAVPLGAIIVELEISEGREAIESELSAIVSKVTKECDTR